MSEDQTAQHPTDNAEVAHELQEIGEEFGCQRLRGETTAAYGLRLLEYVAEMAAEMRAVENRVRNLIASTDRSQ